MSAVALAPAGRPRRLRLARAGVAILLFSLLSTGPTSAQAQDYRLTGPGDAELVLTRDSVLALLEATRALQRELEEDPDILYYTGFGPAVAATEPAHAYPWNAVEVLTDSTAAIRTPGNLREGDRAYQAYAVRRMTDVREDPDVPCDSLMAREAAAVGAFADGWFVARALFGGPPYRPLDELAVARAHGHIEGMMAALGNRQLGGCLDRWSAANREAVRRYLDWRGAPDPELGAR